MGEMVVVVLNSSSKTRELKPAAVACAGGDCAGRLKLKKAANVSRRQNILNFMGWAVWG